MLKKKKKTEKNNKIKKFIKTRLKKRLLLIKQVKNTSIQSWRYKTLVLSSFKAP